jgi:outer membrane protein assembly factor BamB
VLWRSEVQGLKPARVHRVNDQVASTPTTDGERDDSYLESIEPDTEEVLWHREREAFKSGWSTPVVWENAGRREILVYGIWWLTAYDFESGDELWSVPGLADEPIVMPAIGEGLIYVTSYSMGSNLEVEGLPDSRA